MKFENTEVFNFEGALRGMRNPLQSHDKSDSHYHYWLPNENMDKYDEIVNDDVSWEPYYIGESDMELAQRLVLAGDEHAKFMRQIFVSVDITAPLYLWKEFDQFKVGTTTNSQSTMHKLATTPITIEGFEMDDFQDFVIYDKNYDVVSFKEKIIIPIINHLESLRQKYLETKDIRYWKELIRWLPESWLQTRTWTANYAVLRNIYFQRRNHKLVEWHKFCEWIESLPYSKELITLENNNV